MCVTSCRMLPRVTEQIHHMSITPVTELFLLDFKQVHRIIPKEHLILQGQVYQLNVLLIHESLISLHFTLQTVIFGVIINFTTCSWNPSNDLEQGQHTAYIAVANQRPNGIQFPPTPAVSK